MSTEAINVGLLGAGYILHAHAKAVQATQGTALVAVCDISRQRAEAAASEFGIPQVFTSLSEMLAGNCDAVHVLLPPHLHADASRQILNAGKHVLLEKPMALSSADCQALVDLANSKSLKLGVSHNFLFLPGYERMRCDVQQALTGRLDQVTVNWLYPLGLLQFGPFDNWMLQSPGNLVFELGPHLVAFVVDLVGPLDNVNAVASHPIDLPGGLRVLRHWNIIGSRGPTGVSVNLSVVPGQAERSVHLRGLACASHLDFDRDIYWREQTRSNSAVFGNVLGAMGAAGQIARQAVGNFGRSLGGALRKSPLKDPFRESVFRSIAAFYGSFHSTGDSRWHGSFGVEVIRLCEQIVAAAGPLPHVPAVVRVRRGETTRPTALVVGGTGFIGKRLVRDLIKAGISVRVLSRSRSAAQLALEGLDVEVVQGAHDDIAVLERALDGIQVVYHLAKATGARWHDYLVNDVEPTRVLAEAALKHGVRRFIYTGTIDSHFSARDGDVITSDTPLDAKIAWRNHYARSKASCEALLTKMHRERGLPLVIFRPGIVIGVGAPPAQWGVGMFHSDTHVQFWGDGDSKLPLVLVDDVAQALVLGYDQPGVDGQAFLLTDEPCVSGKEYVAAVSQRSGSHIDAHATPIWRFFLKDLLKECVKHVIRHPNRRRPSFRDWGCRAHRARYDSSKTRQLLGWRPAGDRQAIIERGVLAAVDHYLR